MQIEIIEGREYRMPGGLNAFQHEMYLHLIDWKRRKITADYGADRGHDYDAVLPKPYADKFAILYPEIVNRFKQHHREHPFRIHKFFHHMASSQAANINLFLPILTHPNADAILGALKPDFARLARSRLDDGFQVEYFDSNNNLRDKKKVSGTDADIGIAYYNHQDELCLWLIEHKLTEHEFTRCGGAKSHGRKLSHDCTKPFSVILSNKNLCYYHNPCRYEYWNITDANQEFFANHTQFTACPFRGGLNQLWRNQLLGLGIEQDPRQDYRQVYFSVVKHPRNAHLDRTLNTYQELIAHNSKFSVFTSADVIAAAARFADAGLVDWIEWYTELYDL